MKNILIVALLIILVASKVHQQKQDPLQACMAKFCRSQAVACAQASNCTSTLQTCGNALQKDKNINKFDTCLKKSTEAYNIMNCVMNNCANAKSHHEALEILINHMN